MTSWMFLSHVFGCIDAMLEMYWSAVETFRVSVETLPSLSGPRQEAHIDIEEESFSRIVLPESNPRQMETA
jgi:hypothetical protein